MADRTAAMVTTVKNIPPAAASDQQTSGVQASRVYAQPSYSGRTSAVQLSGAAELKSNRGVDGRDGSFRLRQPNLPSLALTAPLQRRADDSERLLQALVPASAPELPSNPATRALVNQGAAHERAKRFEEAAASYERALEITPDDAWLWHRLASVREVQGLRRLAVELARRSNQLAPGDQAVQAANARFMTRP